MSEVVVVAAIDASVSYVIKVEQAVKLDQACNKTRLKITQLKDCAKQFHQDERRTELLIIYTFYTPRVFFPCCVICFCVYFPPKLYLAVRTSVQVVLWAQVFHSHIGSYHGEAHLARQR